MAHLRCDVDTVGRRAETLIRRLQHPLASDEENELLSEEGSVSAQT